MMLAGPFDFSGNCKPLGEFKPHVENSGVLFGSDLFSRLSFRSDNPLPLF